MARITVQDCLPHVNNRFDLVLLSSKRARQIAMGSRPLVSEVDDKPTVLALREIAAGLLDQNTVESFTAREREERNEYEPSESSP